MRVICSHCGSSYSVDGESSHPVACRVCGHGIAIPSPSAPPPRAPAVQARAPATQGGGSAVRKVAPLVALPDPEATPTPDPLPTGGLPAWGDRPAGPALGARSALPAAPPAEGYIDLTIDDVPTPPPRIGDPPPEPAVPARPPLAARAPRPVPSPTVPPADRLPAPPTPLAAPEPPPRARPVAAPRPSVERIARPEEAATPRLARWVPAAAVATVLLAVGGLLLLRGRSTPEAAPPRAPEPTPYFISTEPPPLAEPAPGIEETPRATPSPPAATTLVAQSPEPTVPRAVERPQPRRAEPRRAAPAAREATPAPAAEPVPPPATAAPAVVRVEPIPVPVAVPAAPPAEPALEDAPAYATEGFRKPQPEVPNCVQTSLRIPADLQSFVSGPVTVRFAVNRDGAVSRLEVMGDVPHPRIAEAIRQAVASCKFVPGADAQGRPTSLWLVMPIRFVGR